MSEKSKVRLGAYRVASVVVVLLVCIVTIFLTYGLSLGGISIKSSDWGHFGALLSGVFTLVAAVAASAAFWVSKLQLDKLVSLHTEQEKSLIFERYVKHRNLFHEKCKEIENMLGGRVHVYAPAELYSKLFPSNSPTHCAYKVEQEEETLKSWHDRWHKILKAFQKNDNYEGRFTDAVGDTWMLAGWLKVSLEKKSRISTIELTSHREEIGFGIYDLCSLHADLGVLIEQLSLFVGSSANLKFDKSYIPIKVLIWQRKCFRKIRGDMGLRIKESTPLLDCLHAFFDHLDGELQRERRLDCALGEVWQNLNKAFESSLKLESYLRSQAEFDLEVVKANLDVVGLKEYESHLNAYLGSQP